MYCGAGSMAAYSRRRTEVGREARASGPDGPAEE